MRKFLLITAIVFSVLGIIFTILPLGTLAILPISIALLIGFFAFQKSTSTTKTFPGIILIISAITFMIVIGKVVLIKDKVASDKQFEIKKEESKKEDIKDLEGI